MKNKIIPIAIFVAAILFVSFFSFFRGKNETSQTEDLGNTSQIIFFYGDGCPHCKIVEKYISDNDIGDKVAFQEKEIYKNKRNSAMLLEKAKVCGIDEASIGVPFLWDGEKCYTGDKDLIKFFDNKINENK
jgi:glutaredoxin